MAAVGGGRIGGRGRQGRDGARGRGGGQGGLGGGLAAAVTWGGGVRTGQFGPRGRQWHGSRQRIKRIGRNK